MNGYMTVQEAAEKWGVTPRQVQILCKESRIAAAARMSQGWIVPGYADEPAQESTTRARTKDDKQ